MCVGICSFLYRLGGASGFSKGFRRFGCPVFYILCCSIVALLKGIFSYWILLCIPLYIGTLSLGYSNNQGNGLIKRILAGSAIGCACLPIVILYNGWNIFIFHLPLCILAMTFFGLINPIPEDGSEEANIAALSFLLPIMMI